MNANQSFQEQLSSVLLSCGPSNSVNPSKPLTDSYRLELLAKMQEKTICIEKFKKLNLASQTQTIYDSKKIENLTNLAIIRTNGEKKTIELFLRSQTSSLADSERFVLLAQIKEKQAMVNISPSSSHEDAMRFIYFGAIVAFVILGSIILRRQSAREVLRGSIFTIIKETTLNIIDGGRVMKDAVKDIKIKNREK